MGANMSKRMGLFVATIIITTAVALFINAVGEILEPQLDYLDTYNTDSPRSVDFTRNCERVRIETLDDGKYRITCLK